MNRSTTLQPCHRKSFLIIHDRNETIEHPPLTSLLDLLVAMTKSDAGHLYRFDPAADELRLVSASPATESGRLPRISLQFDEKAREWLKSLDAPVAVTPGHDYSGNFPETAVMESRTLLICPLAENHVFYGLLILCRNNAGAVYDAAEMEPVAKAGPAFVSLISDPGRQREIEALRLKLRSARQEILVLEKRLLERKLVERAKGILQMNHGWSEEDAYYHLRRTSRQQRIPMAVVAQRVIDVSSAKDGTGERLSA